MRHLPIAIALVCMLATPAEAEWVRIESPNFVVFGEIGEKGTREYAAEFERFREALARVVPGTATRPAAPTVVFIFKDAKSFGPYRPLYNGKPVEVGGYFAGSHSMDVIMLPATNRELALRTIYHEYSHLVTANMAGALPAWLAEGLAEYYSTFEVRSDGRSGILGRVIPSHLLRLQADGFIPLEQLLTVEHDSPLYNEGSRRSTFYAQTWALVHLLLNGQPDRSAPFNTYVRLAAAGRRPLEAWHEVFGDQKILDQLRRYVRQAQMKGYLFKFDRVISTASFSVSSPAPADVHAALGDLRLHVEPATAAAHMDHSPSPSTAFTAAVRGLLKLEEKNNADALPLLLQAARESDDWLVQYRAAVGLHKLFTESRDEVGRTSGQAADDALARVLRRRPELPHAVALRGLIKGPGDEGLALLEQARALAPGRAHYAIWLAEFHSARGEYASARELLAPLLSPWLPPETRDYARTVMGAAVTAEQTRVRTAQTRASGRNDPERRPLPETPAVVTPLFREIQSGEQRLEAIFERIECPREGVILHMKIAGRAARFTSPQFEAVEFTSFRDDLTGPIQCGLRTPPDKVYLTFRAALSRPGIDGIVVAVEFLPR